MSNQTPAPVRRRTRSTVARGTATVSTQKKVSGEELTSAPPKTHDFEIPVEGANPAYLAMGIAFTKNLGNYESLKINVQVSLPCANNDEAISACRKKVAKMCDRWLDYEFEQVEAGKHVGNQG